MTYRLTFLGTGSSGGVPRVGNNWGACDRSNPKNRRRRCAVLVERFSKQGRTTVLIDARGKIARIWRNVRVDGHADEVLAAARML